MSDADKSLETLTKTISDAANLTEAEAAKLEDSIGGIIAAFEIWRERIQEATHALALMELPDLSQPISQINQLAQAQADYAKALNDTVASYNSIEAAGDRAIQKIREHTALQKQLAELTKSPTAAIAQAGDEAELAEMDRRMHELTMSAMVKKHMAEEIKVPTAAEDEANLKNVQAQTEAAKKARAEANQNLEMIEKAQQGPYRSPVAFTQYVMKYGATEPYADAMKINRDQIDQASVIIRRAHEMEVEKARRDKLREQQQKLMTEAGREEGEAEVLRQQIPEQRASMRGRETVEYLKEYQQTGSVQDLMGAMGMSLRAQQRLLAEINAHHISQTAVTNQIIATLHAHGIKLVEQQRRVESVGK